MLSLVRTSSKATQSDRQAEDVRKVATGSLVNLWHAENIDVK